MSGIEPVLAADWAGTAIAITAIVATAGAIGGGLYKIATWFYRDRHERDVDRQEELAWRRERHDFEKKSTEALDEFRRQVSDAFNGAPARGLAPEKPGVFGLMEQQRQAFEKLAHEYDNHTEHPPKYHRNGGHT